MARQRKRRSVRKIDDLPSLFDEVSLDFKTPDPYADIIEQHRKQQMVPDVPITSLDIDMRSDKLSPRTQLQFISFGSGSSGNCAYLGIRNKGGILIDAGIDSNKVMKELAANGIPYDKVAGVLLTHDHADHIRFAYQLVRKRPNMHIYCTPRVMQGILQRHSVSRRLRDYHTSIYKEIGFKAGPFDIIAFETSHDGSDNVGFSITAEGKNFVVATDMGIITERAEYYMRLANFMMIESNYDADMLNAGSYPEYLKARIRSPKGHLNNAVTAAFLADNWGKALTDVYLCHLSHDNNTPEKAMNAAVEALKAKGIKVGDATGSVESRNADIRLYALPRFDTSPLFIHRL